MKSYQFLLENLFFTTRELAFRTGKSIDSASRKLKQLEKEGAVVRVTQGIWGQPHHPLYTPYGVVPLLLGNEHGYVSFLTALHKHGAISAIPSSIQIATTGHSRILRSPIGVFEFFKLSAAMFGNGIEESESRIKYYIATAEKALLDTMYISARKGRRFSSLPELDLEEFNEKDFRRLLKEQVKFHLLKEHIIRKWDIYSRSSK